MHTFRFTKCKAFENFKFIKNDSLYFKIIYAQIIKFHTVFLFTEVKYLDCNGTEENIGFVVMY